LAIKIAYIDGGSKEWARVFMNDLALAPDISGSVFLYDIDKAASALNQIIGNRIRDQKDAISRWDYVLADTIDEALEGADFVAISILPGLIETMAVDVHLPEKYGIFQSVGDTVGPGGVIRSLRSVPAFEFFAAKIKAICPDAWVINFTNPMSICVRTLYDVFPGIKAFGCCHEVFHTQDFLCKVLEEQQGIKVNRKDIYTEVSGINHFTWISKATYGRTDILSLLPDFCDRTFLSGYNESGEADAFLADPFVSANRVKMDLFRKYGVLAAAGDRHLAEFMDINLYLKSEAVAHKWKFALTTVKQRIDKRNIRIKETLELASGEKPIVIQKSNEEVVDLIRALLGKTSLVSNVNIVNRNQMPGLPMGRIVETNAFFTNDNVVPLISGKLPDPVLELVRVHSDNLELLYSGIGSRDWEPIFRAFMNQPLCSGLQKSEGRDLFKEMVHRTGRYLEKDYVLSGLQSL